jgi:hypothetical protein
VSVSAFGQVFIIINSPQIASDLLNKKSAIYSDRPIQQFGGELCGFKDVLTLLQYTERFRQSRKMFHRVLGSPSIFKKFQPIVEEESHKFLRRVLLKPQELASNIRQ